MLNHVKKSLSFDVLEETIKCVNEVGLTTIVRADFMAGADATGSSSGVAKAVDCPAMVDEMIAAARRAWDERHS